MSLENMSRSVKSGMKHLIIILLNWKYLFIEKSK